MVIIRLINRIRRLRKENAKLREEKNEFEFRVSLLLIERSQLNEKLAQKPKTVEETLENIERELVSARRARAYQKLNQDVWY